MAVHSNKSTGVPIPALNQIIPILSPWVALSDQQAGSKLTFDLALASWSMSTCGTVEAIQHFASHKSTKQIGLEKQSSLFPLLRLSVYYKVPIRRLKSAAVPGKGRAD